METIQIVLDTPLLKAVDLAARRQKVNRSALIRHALQEHLKRLRIKEMEEQERRAYQLQPQTKGEWEPWVKEQAWPED